MSDLPRALLLDLDDTLVSFSAGPRDFWSEAIEEAAPGWVRQKEVRAAIDRSAAWFWSEPDRAARGRLALTWARRQVVALAFWQLELSDTELAIRIADTFTREKGRAVEPFPGAVDAVRRFRTLGLKLALVTNGHPRDQLEKLERHRMVDLFDAIVIEGAWGIGKPDPTIFVEALRRIDCRPEDGWMVGDNLRADVEGAQRVGLVGVWHDVNGSGLPPQSPVRPDRIIRHVGDLFL